jgi:hypothetical protein
MARHETDREDLIAEATALRQRVELELPGAVEKVTAGFRDNGGGSVYFGADPVYHFDADGGLRRAFVAGDLYRSQGKTLARLTRTRTGSEVHLVRHDLDAAELAGFLAAMRGHLDRLHNALVDNSVRVAQQVPAAADIRPQLFALLSVARLGRLSKAIRKR